MAIVIMALVGVLLAFLLVRYGPIAQKRAQNADDGLHGRRIGDGLKRLNAMKAKYAVMTRQLLDETSDDGLIEAVLSNLWAKMAQDMSDALTVISKQSPGRRMIFSLYAVTGGARQAGFAKLMESPDAALLPDALDGLQALQMHESAAILREAVGAGDDADSFRAPYADAFAAEDGKGRMAAYIRENPSDFLDLA